MSLVSKKDILELGNLARLALTDREVCSLQDDLEGILAHMSVLAEVDTEGVLPMSHPVQSRQALRPDVVQPSLTQSEALGQSARTEEDCFAVPSILP